MGTYSAPDDGRFGPGHDQQTLHQLRGREQELLESHWRTFVCSRGHVIEGHRQAGGTALSLRCPICGGDAANEPPAMTALREHRAQNTPLALLSRAFDAMGEWAQNRLNAQTWTIRSQEQRRAAQMNGENTERRPASLLKNPFPQQ